MWNPDKDIMPGSDDPSITNDKLTLYACWEPAKEVYFVYWDGNEEKQEIADTATTVTRPAEDPTREGYVFQGWYTDETYKTEFDFSQEITSWPVRVYAKWQRQITWADTATEQPEGFAIVEEADGAPSKIEISSPEGLGYLAAVVNGTATLPEAAAAARTGTGNNLEGCTITLTEDIDLGEKEWTPIGAETHAFQGVFDGAEHTISGLKITDASQQDGTLPYMGLFGRTGEGAEIKNFTVKGEIAFAQNVFGENDVQFVGGVCGLNTCTRIENVVSNVDITITTDGNNGFYLNVGGVTGRNQSGTVKNCVNQGAITITADQTDMGQQFAGGGVVGRNGSQNGTILDYNYGPSIVDGCINQGAITFHNIGAGWAGGVVGASRSSGNRENTAEVYNCANFGAVKNTADRNERNSPGPTGGVLANNSDTYFANCYNFGAVQGGRDYIYNNRDPYTGGLCGTLAARNNFLKGYISNSYNYGKVNKETPEATRYGAFAGNDTLPISNSYWWEDSAKNAIGSGNLPDAGNDSFIHSNDTWVLSSTPETSLQTALNTEAEKNENYYTWIPNDKNLPIFGGTFTLNLTQDGQPLTGAAVSLKDPETGKTYLFADQNGGVYTAYALYPNGEYQEGAEGILPSGKYELIVNGSNTGDAVDIADPNGSQNVTITGSGGGSNSGGSGTTAQYTLRYDTNGGTVYDDERYASGTVVNLDKTPSREGYTFTGWYADAALTDRITEIKMTSSKTVYAGWEITGVPECLNGDDHFAYVIGYSDGTVRPQGNITRAEVATIFFRLLTPEIRDGSLTTDNVFSDVDGDDWFNTAASTLARLGIFEGRSAETFAPDAPITRAEFAAICARFAAGQTTGDSEFTDISGHWAEAEIERAAALGWVNGYDDDTFRPNNPITRAEAMTLINRMLQRLPEDESDLLSGMNVWPDNKPGAWYYLAVQEATNSHDFERKDAALYEHWTALTPDPDWTRYE